MIQNSYYDLTTDNIEFGWNTRFHFCPFTDPDECIDTAMKQHEHFLALMMSLKPGMRGLDVGCGIGAPSRDLVRFVDVHITGISINKLHIERAREQASEAGLAKKLEYVEGDFMVGYTKYSCILRTLTVRLAGHVQVSGQQLRLCVRHRGYGIRS